MAGYFLAELQDTYTTPTDVGFGIAVDTSGNVYCTGFQYNSAGHPIAFVAKYNTSGVIQWQRSLTDTYTSPGDYGRCIAVDTSGNVYCTGQQLNSAGYTIAFVFTAPTDGTLTGTYSTSLGGLTYAAGSLTDAAGALTDAAGSLTDAADTLTDAAGALTDAAGALTTATNEYYIIPSANGNFFAFMGA